MKISKMISRPGPGDVFSRMHRQRGNRAYVTWFADDNEHTGAGSTVNEAVSDLRAQRKMSARWGYNALD